MKKAEVLSKLGGLSGYDVRPEVDMSGELYLLRIRKGNSDFAWISFKDGAVSQIFRTDHDYFSPEAIKAFKDLWDALHDINDNENETVAAVTTRVKTFTIHDPPTTHFDMWISFTNGKTVHIGWYSEGGESAASIEQQLSKPSL